MSPAAPPVWTVKALLDWTADFLAKKNVPGPAAKLDARLLLAHVLKCKPIDVLVRYDEQPTDADRTTFRELIKRRVDGWPVAYLLGEKEFFLLPFEVTPAVLIPRPETETLVGEAVSLLKKLPSPTALDLCTGSGCVAVSLAHGVKAARVTATDVSPDALDVARRNAARNKVAERIDFLAGDLFAPLPDGAAFDVVATNPPYVTQTELAGLQPEVRDHEPRLALDGGPDGLAFYRRIAAGVDGYLKPGGWLLAEIGATQGDAVAALFAERLDVEKTLRDVAGLPRVVVARKRR
ncbi:MAG TPA: peptide chain release factor N(5)-glutamine methyltransferase [Urbifossiella sp.]|nr:peptide chain release factor N(5)-glutamine methyltransferase [Urbifossiella sp.]